MPSGPFSFIANDKKLLTIAIIGAKRNSYQIKIAGQTIVNGHLRNSYREWPFSFICVNKH